MTQSPVAKSEHRRRLRAMVRCGYNITRAARVLGLPRATLQSWSTAHAIRERQRAAPPAPVRDVEGELRTRLRVVERQRDELAGAIVRERETRARVIPRIRSRHRTSSDRVLIAWPDTHGRSRDDAAVAAATGDVASLSPDLLVVLGDLVDCGGFLAQHHSPSYVSETSYSYEDDCAAANEVLDGLQAAAPRASIDYLEGNHEQRVEKWAVTSALRHAKDAEALRIAMAPEYKLRLAARGIAYHRRSVKAPGIRVPGIIRRGKCYFVHGISTARHAASVHVARFGASVVYGHTHRAQSDLIRTVGTGEIGAWSPGCLCQQQPYYEHGRPTDWSLGYHLQLIARSGAFLAFNVPIIGGHSHLTPLLGRMSLPSRMGLKGAA